MTTAQSKPDVLDATVVISRSYLDQLLHSSLQAKGTGNSGSFTAHQVQQQHHVSAQPGTVLPQPSAVVPQPGAVVSQPGAVVSQPGMVVPQPSAVGPQTGAVVSQPGTMVPQTTVAVMQTRDRWRESPAEEYFPFGRPGCGAPLRTDSGQVIADLRQRTKLHQDPLPGDTSKALQAPASSLSVTQAPPHSQLAPPLPLRDSDGGRQVKGSEELSSPRYARGGGPHVDQYVLKDREDKRRKELEHVVSM